MLAKTLFKWTFSLKIEVNSEKKPFCFSLDQDSPAILISYVTILEK